MNLNKIYFLKREVLFTLFIFTLIFGVYNFTKAITVEELKDQIEKVTATKAKLEKEIEAYEKQLKDISVQTTSLSNTIKSLNANISKNTLDIKLTENNINSTELEIHRLSLDIDKNTDIIDKNIEAIDSLINDINTYGDVSFVESLLKYKNLSEFWNEQQNIYVIQSKIKDKIIETKNTKTILETNKSKAEKKKAELLKLKSGLVDQKKLLEITKKEKDKLLSETKNSEANYKKLLADKKALADAFDKELLQFESQLRFAIDQSSIPRSGSGVLSWPLSVIKITQRFGVTEFSKTTNAYNGKGHNGVDFGAPIGTPIKSASSGIVKGTGNTDIACPGASFGQWILIEHNNGLTTLYAHLSLIKVSAGQSVFTGDIIGYTGNTGFSTGPHLHFGVYASQGIRIMSRSSTVCKTTYTLPVADLRAYLDPLQYL